MKEFTPFNYLNPIRTKEDLTAPFAFTAIGEPRHYTLWVNTQTTCATADLFDYSKRENVNSTAPVSIFCQYLVQEEYIETEDTITGFFSIYDDEDYDNSAYGVLIRLTINIKEQSFEGEWIDVTDPDNYTSTAQRERLAEAEIEKERQRLIQAFAPHEYSSDADSDLPF